MGIRTELAASPRNTSRPTKPTSVGVPAAKAGASTTWYSWQAQLKFASANSKGASISVGPGVTQDAFVLPFRQIAAPSRWADLSSAPLHPVPPSSPMTGAVTRNWANAAIAIPLSRKRRHASCPDIPADHSPRVLQSQDLAARHPSRCQPTAPISLSQRIHLPLLPLQRLPFSARHRWRCHRAHIRRSLRRKITNHYI